MTDITELLGETREGETYATPTDAVRADRLERFLRKATHMLAPDSVRIAREELAEHYRRAYLRRRASGVDEWTAHEHAMKELGKPNEVAGRYRRVLLTTDDEDALTLVRQPLHPLCFSGRLLLVSSVLLHIHLSAPGALLYVPLLAALVLCIFGYVIVTSLCVMRLSSRGHLRGALVLLNLLLLLDGLPWTGLLLWLMPSDFAPLFWIAYAYALTLVVGIWNAWPLMKKLGNNHPA